ncbi:MAG: hypothetical protein AAGF02_06110, partial [Actinomycetota bacterium]
MIEHLLRPVHRWFHAWESTFDGPNRVAAVAVGAALTTVVAVVAGRPPIRSTGVALGGWILLGIAQEHDGRITSEPDERFVAALAEAVSHPPLSMRVERADGRRRGRPEEPDTTVTLRPEHADGHPLATHFVCVDRDDERGF